MPSSLDASVFRMFISFTVQVKIQILPVITTYEIFFCLFYLWYWVTVEKKKKERKFVTKFQNFIFQKKKNVA